MLAIKKATDKSHAGKKFSVAKETSRFLMMSHYGFSSRKLCYCYLLSFKNIDEVVLASFDGKLNGKGTLSSIWY